MRFADTAPLACRAAGWRTRPADADTLDLVGPISDYKIYVSDHMDKLVKNTEAFVAAIKAGDVEKAKALYAPTRMNYETIEPIAELFSDLDVSIDSRAPTTTRRPRRTRSFTGFHRIEYGLWEKDSTEGLAADRRQAARRRQGPQGRIAT